MTLVSFSLTKKRLKLTKNYKTLELTALEITPDTKNMVIIRKPPKQLCRDNR